MLEAKTVTRM